MIEIYLRSRHSFYLVNIKGELLKNLYPVLILICIILIDLGCVKNGNKCLAKGRYIDYFKDSCPDDPDNRCAAIDWTKTGSGYWSNYKTCLEMTALAGSSGSVSTSLISFTNSDSMQWNGGALATNGKIYGLPNSGLNPASVLKIDPDAGSVSKLSFANTARETWFGGILAPNGKIYGIPSSSGDPTYILLIDPSNDGISTLSFANAASHSWAAGVLAPSGIIYATSSSGVDPALIMKINPSSNSISTISVSNAASEAWVGAVLGPDGKIYFIPASGNNPGIVLVLDPSTETTTSISFTNAAGSGWWGGAIAPNGKIYALSKTGNPGKILIVDPTAATASLKDFTNSTSTQSSGLVLAPNGLMYSITSVDAATSTGLIFNYSTETVSTYSFTGVVNTSWIGGVGTTSGKIYGMPAAGLSTTEYVLVIDSKSVGHFPSGIALSSFVNKF